MSLINKDYFIKPSKGLFKLPYIDLPATDGEGARQQLDEFILAFEPELLKETLGESLYLAFVAGLAVIPVAEKWTNLQNRLIDATNKKSPIANYVFCKMMEVVPGLAANIKSETGEVIDTNSAKFRMIYNEMVGQLEVVQLWIIDNLAMYTEFDECYLWTSRDKMNALGL